MEMQSIQYNMLGSRPQKLKLKQKFAAFLPVFTLILPSQLALNTPWQMAFNVGVVLFILGGLLLPGVAAQRYGALLITLFTLLLVAAGISTVFNRWPRSLIVYGGLTLGYVSAIRAVGCVKDPAAFLRLLILGICLTTLGIMIASLIVQPPRLRRYSGIFQKSNAVGWFGSSVCSLLMGVFVYSRTRWRKKEFLFMLGVLVLGALFTIACNARSALAGLGAAIGMFAIAFFHSFLMRSKVRRKRIVLGLSLIGFMLAFGYYFGFLDVLIEKFDRTTSAGDISQGRFEMWSIHIKHWQWFGNGPRLISHYISHNTYVDHLTKYGLLPLLLFVGFLSVLLLSGYYYTIKGTYQAAPILLAVTSCFMAQAMFETGTSTPGIWIAIVVYSCLRYEIHNSSNQNRIPWNRVA